jgi:hypothetical protein
MNTYNAFTTITLSVSTNSISATSVLEAERKFREKVQSISVSSDLNTEIINIDEYEVFQNSSLPQTTTYTSMASLLSSNQASTPPSDFTNSSRYIPLVPNTSC